MRLLTLWKCGAIYLYDYDWMLVHCSPRSEWGSGGDTGGLGGGVKAVMKEASRPLSQIR